MGVETVTAPDLKDAMVAIVGAGIGLAGLLLTLYDAHKAAWIAILRNAVTFLDATLPANERIRPEDCAEAIAKVVAADDNYRAFVEHKKLREKRWGKDFSDYIVELNFTQDLAKRTKKP